MKFKDDRSRRTQLLTIFSKALQAANGRSCVSQFFSSHPESRDITHVVAVGKAAESMLSGALESCHETIKNGLLITKRGYLRDADSLPVTIDCLETSHPHPDQSSLDAGQKLLQFISRVPETGKILFLISGGASSLVEVLPDGVTEDNLNMLSSWLLAQGWPIEEMNCIRKSVSCIKGGRLVKEINARSVLQLLISDVPGDDLSVIGSGLLVADLCDKDVSEKLPEWLTRMQTRVPRVPDSSDACFRNIESHIIANNKTARAAAETAAIQQGFRVQCNEAMEGDIFVLGKNIAQALITGGEGVYIWGGEGTIELPAHPGSGGRAQALALFVAKRIEGINGITLLSAGTDGTDGPGDAAGALVDGQTVNRGVDAGFEYQSAIAHADTGSFLAGSGDLIDTGSTGTNVMDLVIAIKRVN